MPLNHYVTLGRSGLRVSPLCLGAMTFGEDWGWGSSVSDTEAIMDRFFELGGNFIDTANAYTKGHSEKIIGDHVGRHPSKRDRLVIATKFFSNLYAGDPNGGGASRKAIIAACEQSLRRLQTSYIDLYWMHAWEPHTPIEETMAALESLVQAGKVRYIGFSDTPAWKCAEAQITARFRGWTPLIALQIEYSLLQRTVEGELIPMAQERPRCHPLVAAEERRAERKVRAGQARSARSGARPLGPRQPERLDVRPAGRPRCHREGARYDGVAGRHLLGAESTRGDVDHHRRADDAAARGQPGGH